mmetsp:Transcript_3006/g.2597  ORF Transcript_3006/g.2597 Transcript_3006/m.2597 type:complete len:130 (+) Transcript_3006:296-685(+)|eukprot:CAMPEP_0114594082 /NCGR_PEP_ID=MMETSP0125-20121206/15694_1 /TAXON_ID=485358 ORGANISM="Aristerostoma sp., Strain ATCC 50986" /NCGR_SAMPLE_ID=MMETSP0125 /ASSEMBLY_ACC=CAM_ASM_000245 /LENGTH=129 /DNA_ID=CAMNT_0001793941 /DNA_START=254 /DNA_END=643 /DNA_ORIENTATION=+
MKVFPYENSETISPYYKREARFKFIDHPNLIKVIDTVPLVEGKFKGESVKTSYVLMDYAIYGDFLMVIHDNNIPKDEVLARTYFDQLIDGIDYLHSKGFVHLDLKAENLLLSHDFKLKICDFDTCQSDD